MQLQTTYTKLENHGGTVYEKTSTNPNATRLHNKNKRSPYALRALQSRLK